MTLFHHGILQLQPTRLHLQLLSISPHINAGIAIIYVNIQYLDTLNFTTLTVTSLNVLSRTVSIVHTPYAHTHNLD